MQREMSEAQKAEVARIERDFSVALESSMPHLEQVQRAMASMTEPIRAAVAAMQPSIAMAHEAFKAHEVIVPFVPRETVRTMRLAPDQFEAFAPKKVSNELLYNWRDQELSRTAMGQKIYFSFVDKKDNKRRRLVERILRTRAYVATKTLASLLRLPEKQVGNMVAAINDMVGVDLTLPEPLIDSKRGSGYRINPFYLVYQKK